MEQDGDKKHSQGRGISDQPEAIHTQGHKARIVAGPAFHPLLCRKDVENGLGNMDVASSQEQDKELCVPMPVLCRDGKEQGTSATSRGTRRNVDHRTDGQIGSGLVSSGGQGLTLYGGSLLQL